MSSTPTHGSDFQVTPEWWKASDGRFYPPELHPDYKAPVAAAGAMPSEQGLALSDRLREAAERAGDASGGSTIAAGARSTFDSHKAAVADAMAKPADAMVADAMAASDVMAKPAQPALPADARATIPQAPPSGPPIVPTQHTIIQTPGAARPVVPQAPAAPTFAAPAAPQYSAPSAPQYSPPSVPQYGQPAAPQFGAPPAPQFGAPAGPQFGAPTGTPAYGIPATPAGVAFQPSSPAAAATKASSGLAGLLAVLGGAAAIAGSLMQWGKGAVTGADGAERAVITVAGFDSNGLLTAICGGVLILCGLLFFLGVPKQLYWAIAAFVAGGAIVGAAVFSLIDIGDLSNRYAAEWAARGFAAPGDVISTKPDIGLWLAGAGGVIGVLAAPFVNRS